MDFEGKYEPISTKQLLEYVQDEARALADHKRLKKGSTKSYMRRGNELSSARAELVKRLKAMDRFDVSFFPPGRWVEYTSWTDRRVVREGKVMAHENGMVVVHLEPLPDTPPDPFNIKVEPRFLKLMYIRHKY